MMATKRKTILPVQGKDVGKMVLKNSQVHCNQSGPICQRKPLTTTAPCGYSGDANKQMVMSKHLKTAFSIFTHPIKSFSVKNPVAVRPGTIFVSFAILGGFLFSGGPQ